MKYDRGENLASLVRVEFPDWTPWPTEHPTMNHPADPVNQEQSAGVPKWVEEAQCRDNPVPFRRGSVAAAQLVCAQCEVKDQCLDYSIENGGRPGVWSGLSERRRKKYDDATEAGRLTTAAAIDAAKIERNELLEKLSDK